MASRLWYILKSCSFSRSSLLRIGCPCASTNILKSQLHNLLQSIPALVHRNTWHISSRHLEFFHSFSFFLSLFVFNFLPGSNRFSGSNLIGSLLPVAYNSVESTHCQWNATSNTRTYISSAESWLTKDPSEKENFLIISTPNFRQFSREILKSSTSVVTFSHYWDI